MPHFETAIGAVNTDHVILVTPVSTYSIPNAYGYSIRVAGLDNPISMQFRSEIEAKASRFDLLRIIDGEALNAL